MFRTKYQRIEKVSNPGDPIRIVRAGEIDKKTHNLVVVEKGKEDLYAKINSFADSCNIHVLLARFRNGDNESLLQRAGAFIDISAMPANINDFIALSRNAENLFNSLPVSVKESFNNNVVEFISTIGDPEWKEKMSKSEAQILNEQSEEFKSQKKAHTVGAKVQFNNSVYGDQPVDQSEVETVDVTNPLTGNGGKK